jgi:Uma2 family endonuclease
MTAEEFMLLPEDGMDRELIRGQLRERPMTVRNRAHSETEVTIGSLLRKWLTTQPEPRGRISGGEAGFLLKRDPDCLVGIDVAYASAERVESTAPDFPYYDGPPVLAVEILSPSEKHADIVEKVSVYLEVGSVVWVVDPDFRTVSVHRRDHDPETYNVRQELSGDPYLPGFRVKVADFFE